MKTKIAATLSLSGIALLIGIFFLFSGIKGVVHVSRISKDYEITEGYFFDYEIYSKGGYDSVKKRYTNDTYQLIYRYRIDGQEYKISTDIGVGIVPEIGSVREIRYDPDNPGNALLAGPDSNMFKIFFGLFFIAIPSFFIWIFLPEKKKADKKPKKTEIDVLGVIISLVFLFFSYGSLYFITGELSVSGIVNFYRRMFIFPMIIPVLMLAAGGYLLIKSIFFKHKKIARTCMFVGISFLAIMIGVILTDDHAEPETINIAEKVDFTVVHTILSERDFETANIPTTYWFYDESKLKNVVSGIKDDTAFEFYEYVDGETTEGVYQSILDDISQNMEELERQKYETELQDGGKMFVLTEKGIRSIVMYENNVVIYAYSQEKQSEIKEILIELGYSAQQD